MEIPIIPVVGITDATIVEIDQQQIPVVFKEINPDFVFKITVRGYNNPTNTFYAS